MIITFIGNCQTVGLCFYLQRLLHSKNYDICWILYGEEFRPHVNEWSVKCQNKILDYDTSILKIKESDIIIYQNIDINKSVLSNTNTLNELKKTNCRLIQIPSIYLIYNDYDNSIKELIYRENKNKVDITVSSIFMQFKHQNLMLTCHHPTTFLFMELLKILCKKIEIDFFRQEEYNYFMQNNNFMELPS